MTAAGSAYSDQAPSETTLRDQEPIARLERIQSFGFLLALSRDWVITAAGARAHGL